MQLQIRQSRRTLIASVLALFFLLPVAVVAQNHVVSPADLRNEAVAASQTRQQNLEAVQKLLFTPTAEKAMKSAAIDPRQVKTGLATLNDEELAQLAARANKAQADFAAGDLSSRELLWIILGIAALVLIIVAVR
jgi:Flp pilus assembly protein TadB